MAGFPSLSDLLTALSFLGDQPAAIGILISGLVLVVVRDWRWSLLALAIQYLLAGWLLTQVLEPRIAILKLLAGMMICIVFYITARQVSWGDDETQNPSPAAQAIQYLHVGRWQLRTSLLFRLLIGILTAVVIFYTAESGKIALPELPTHINLAAIAMMALGLLNLGLTEEPLKGGMGLLTLLAGFELFYHSLEQAITVIGFMIGVSFVITIVSAYLTVARHMPADRS